MTTYPYSSVQKIGDHDWMSHIQTDDYEEAKDEAELDHMDHPEYAHGVMDNATRTVVFVIEAE